MNSHFYLDPKAKVHSTVEIGFGAWIGPNVYIGKNVKIGPYCVIGSQPEHKDFFNKKTEFGVSIYEGTRLSEFITIHAGTIQETVIGSDTAIFQKSHIGHDVIVEKNVIIGGGCSMAGHTYVMEGAYINGHACTVPYAVIGAYAFLGATSFLTRHASPGEKVIGNPARSVGNNDIGMERSGLDISMVTDLYLERFYELTKGKLNDVKLPVEGKRNFSRSEPRQYSCY